MRQDEDPEGPRSKGVVGRAMPSNELSVQRHFPAPDLAHLVRHYWIPRWDLPVGKSIVQDVLPYATSNLAIEPHSAAMFGPQFGLSSRLLTGRGWAFGVMFQPATARLLLGDMVEDFRVGPKPLENMGGAELTERVKAAHGDDGAMIALFDEWLRVRGIEQTAESELLNSVVAAVEGDRGILRVEALAARFGLSIRTLQRLSGHYLSLTPKELIRQYRLQEAAHTLASGSTDLATLAADLGYADQAHFSRDFATVTGRSPAEYRRETR